MEVTAVACATASMTHLALAAAKRSTERCFVTEGFKRTTFVCDFSRGPLMHVRMHRDVAVLGTVGH
jgi:hypothetical protein